jgi:hypothetical protein
VLECEQLYVDPHYYGGAQHRMTAFHVFFSEWPYEIFSSVSQYTSDVIVIPYCMNSTISAPFLSQKTVAISFLAGRQRLFKPYRRVLWICMHPLLWLLSCFNIHELNPKFHHLLLVRCDREIHCHLYVIALKSQSRSRSLPFVRTREHFRNPSCAKLVIA